MAYQEHHLWRSYGPFCSIGGKGGGRTLGNIPSADLAYCREGIEESPQAGRDGHRESYHPPEEPRYQYHGEEGGQGDAASTQCLLFCGVTRSSSLANQIQPPKQSWLRANSPFEDRTTTTNKKARITFRVSVTSNDLMIHISLGHHFISTGPLRGRGGHRRGVSGQQEQSIQSQCPDDSEANFAMWSIFKQKANSETPKEQRIPRGQPNQLLGREEDLPRPSMLDVQTAN